jgi:hypothetical protein
MTNGDGYQSLYDPADVTVDGAVTLEVTGGDANSGANGQNTQENGFQVGVTPPSEPFYVNTTVSGMPSDPVDFQTMGIQLGTGDQGNYVKLVAAANGGTGGIELGKEENDGGLSGTTVVSAPGVVGPDSQTELSMVVDPATNTVEAYYRTEGGDWTFVDSRSIPGEWLDTSDGTGLAVGLTGTSVTSSGSEPFDATWENLVVETVPDQASDNSPPTADAGADLTVDEGAAVVLDASGSSDPDAGDSLSYAWSVADDAGTGVSLSDAGTATPEFTAPEVSGEATLTFEVSVDDGSASATDTVAVTVQDAGDEPSASDFDGDGVPNAEDSDDDNDGQPDTTDPFAIDPDDGTTTSTPVNLEFEPDSEPGTILGVGFTGLMTNGDGYQSLYDPADVTVDGAISYEVDDSDANDDTQERGFQVGVSPPTDQPWAVNTTVSGLPGPGSAQQYQLLGIQLGTGDQKNYVKLAAAAQGGGSVEFGKEEADDWETELTGDSSVLGPDTQVHLSIAVYPSTNTVEGFYRVEGGDWTSTGITYDVPGSWLDASDGSAPAVGLIGTSVGAPSFTGTWENLTVETLDAGSGQVNSLSGAAVAPGPTRPAVTDGGPARLAATSRTGVDPIVGAASGAGASR